MDDELRPGWTEFALVPASPWVDDVHLEGVGIAQGRFARHRACRSAAVIVAGDRVPVRVHPIDLVEGWSDGSGSVDHFTVLALAEPADAPRLRLGGRSLLEPGAVAFYLFQHCGEPAARWAVGDLVWPRAAAGLGGWSLLDDAIAEGAPSVEWFDGELRRGRKG